MRPPKVARFLSVCLSPIGFCSRVLFLSLAQHTTALDWLGFGLGMLVNTEARAEKFELGTHFCECLESFCWPYT
jgi:hypothetical protein